MAKYPLQKIRIKTSFFIGFNFSLSKKNFSKNTLIFKVLPLFLSTWMEYINTYTAHNTPNVSLIKNLLDQGRERTVFLQLSSSA